MRPAAPPLPRPVRPVLAADRLDALLWLAGLLLLAWVPVGRVSGDGLGYALRFAAGAWGWNPNHLLFEPAGMAWHRALAALGSTRPVVDQLKLLSLASGAVAAALFRHSVARRLADRRWAANYATAWLVLGSTYSRLLVGDEFHMIQMPFLVLLAAAVLRHLERPGLARALAAGAAAGGAALCFASNVLLGVTAATALAALHLARGERGERLMALRAAAGLLAGLLLVTAAGAGLAWHLARPSRPFAAWLASYAGGAAPPRTGLAYGVRWTADGLALSAARALYGSGGALVDLAPAVAAVRDRGEPARAAGIGLAWLLGAAALGGGLASALARREPADRAALLLQAVWWPAVLGFGLSWNNSDDQFYFQLAVAFGALAARLPARLPEHGRAARFFLACGALALAWNAADLAARFLLYPRAAWTAELTRELEGACLVVVPGWDDASNLLTLAGGSGGAERLPLAELAVAMPAERGLPRLAAEARRCLVAGRRVDLVEVYDSPPQAPPWKFLRQLGYERGAVERALEAPGATIDREPRAAGPFRVRSLRPPAPVRP